MEKTLETLQSEYIVGLKEQIETMKKLNTLNDQIIKSQNDRITELERVIEELNELTQRSIDLAKQSL